MLKIKSVISKCKWSIKFFIFLIWITIFFFWFLHWYLRDQNQSNFATAIQLVKVDWELTNSTLWLNGFLGFLLFNQFDQFICIKLSLWSYQYRCGHRNNCLKNKHLQMSNHILISIFWFTYEQGWAGSTDQFCRTTL